MKSGILVVLALCSVMLGEESLLAQRRRGDWIAFSILVNNYNGPASEVRAVMDKICGLLVMGEAPR